MISLLSNFMAFESFRISSTDFSTFSQLNFLFAFIEVTNQNIYIKLSQLGNRLMNWLVFS